MRRPFIAGNWKMNLNRAAAVDLAEGIVKRANKIEGVDLAVCPPSCYLDAVGRAVAGSKVALGAKTCITKRTGRLPAS